VRVRAVLALALLALSLCDLPAHAQVSVASNAPIGLGFGPTSLRPIGDGVPIYTVGDQMWVTSYSQSSLMLNLTDPSGVLVAQQFVGPNSSSLFYSFSSSDPEGVWTLDTALAFVPQNVQVTPILLAKPSPSATTMTGYKLLGNGQLSMNFTIASATAYDIGACLVGSGLPDAASVPIPSKQGVGQLGLGRSGREVSVSLEGQVTNPFTFWLELHQDYSYLLQGTSTVVSRDVLAAESNAVAVPIGRSNLTKAVFQNDLRMRTGRYTLRAFFEGSGGLSAYETSVLLTNSNSWIWLEGCTAASSSLISSFTLASSLTRPISQWPRGVYTMYKDEGIDMFSLESLDVMPTAVAVFASPWGAALTSAHPSLIPNTNVDGFAFVNNTIYLTAKQYPATFAVSLLGGGSKETYSIQVGPFSVNVLNISTTKVVVSTLQDGKPLSGVSVTLKYNNETLATLSTKAGKAIFYVPAADYTVGASFGNSTMVGSVAGRAGIEADVTFDFGGSPSQVISYLLIVTGVPGLLASLWLWVRIYRRRALRLDRGRAFRQNADSAS
jgi:hypothetical protein